MYCKCNSDYCQKTSQRFHILCPFFFFFYKLSNVFVFANGTFQFVQHNIQVNKNDGLNISYTISGKQMDPGLPVPGSCALGYT